jgi:hypothetical protein
MKLFEMFEGMKGPKKLKESEGRLQKLKKRTCMSEADIDEAVAETEIVEDDSLQVGDKVHLGFGAKGGAGFYGTIIDMDEYSVWIKHENGNTYKGPIKNVTKNEVQEESKKFKDLDPRYGIWYGVRGDPRKAMIRLMQTHPKAKELPARQRERIINKITNIDIQELSFIMKDLQHLGIDFKRPDDYISNPHPDPSRMTIPGPWSKGKRPATKEDTDKVREGWGAEGQKRDMEAMLAAKEKMLNKYADNPEMVSLLKDYMSKGWNAAAAEKEALSKLKEGYSVLPPIDDRYQERDGLEGPFRTTSGKVLYYDPREGRYYDPDTDMYLSHEEYDAYNAPDSSKTGKGWYGQNANKGWYEDVEEARGIEGMARKFVPGYGKRKAKNRADDYGFSGNLDAEYAKHFGDEDAARDARIAFKAQKKYKKIAGEGMADMDGTVPFYKIKRGFRFYNPNNTELALVKTGNNTYRKALTRPHGKAVNFKIDPNFQVIPWSEEIAAAAPKRDSVGRITGESIADMDVTVKSYGKKGDGIDPTGKVIVQHIDGGKKYYYKPDDPRLEKVKANIAKGAPYHILTSDYDTIFDEDMAQAINFAQADSEKARNPKAKKFGPSKPSTEKNKKKDEVMPDVYFAMEDLTEAPDTTPNQLQQEAADSMGFEFDGVVYVRRRLATKDNPVTEIALHAVNPESGEHAMVFNDGGVVRGSSVEDLAQDGWIAQGENLKESWPVSYIEKKVNLKNLARMLDNGKKPEEIRGLETLAKTFNLTPTELADIASKKYLDSKDYNQFNEQRKFFGYLNKITESIATFQIDDPMDQPKDFEFTGSPEWAGKAKTHGINRGGQKARAEIGGTKEVQDIKDAWTNLLGLYKRTGQSPAIKQKLLKVRMLAQKKGIDLPGGPVDDVHTLGLGQ